jgi:hypothetical protein
LPRSAAALVMVIQATSLRTLHSHVPMLAVTAIVPVPPVPEMLNALRSNVRPQTGLCVIVNDVVPIVIVPVRSDVPVLADADHETVDPLEVTVIQDALVDAVHVHCEATAIVPDPPGAGTVALFGVSVNWHDPAACVTVNVWPAIVSVPVRCEGVWLACTVYPTLPSPVPDWPYEIVIHGALLDADRGQVREFALTSTKPLPPPAAKLAVLGEMMNEHGSCGRIAKGTPINTSASLNTRFPVS